MILKTKHKILLASLAFRVARFDRLLPGKGSQAVFKRNSFQWELDLREVIDFMIYASGGFESYLSKFIQKNVKDGDVVMDIGANIGAHTLSMGKSVGSNDMAYADEATEYAFSKLQTNIKLNPDIATRIQPCHRVLVTKEASANESLEVTSIHSSWPFNSADERHPEHQGVLKPLGNPTVSSLDELIMEKGITRLDLVKIDVDGHEWDVLSGGFNTFKKLRPIIVMELAPDYNAAEHARSFKNIHKFLIGLDYRFYDFKGRKLPEETEALAATIPNGASRNVVISPMNTRDINYN